MTHDAMRPATAFPFQGEGPGIFFRSIKGKIFLVFAVTLLSAGLLTLLNFWSLHTVEERLLLGERYDDLLNNILEVRRFEKNHLLYADAESQSEGLEYLERIDTLAEELGADMALVAGRDAAQSFRSALGTYEEAFRALPSGSAAVRDAVRSRGKALVDLTDDITRTKRARIHASLLRASVLPFAFLGVVLLLMFLVIKLISRGMLRPLDVLRSTTERVARGDFSPIPPEPGQLLEISGLTGAFNRMAQELEANQEDLLQARKIAALGTFTAGIAHELNNPLNNIALTGEAFLEEYGDSLDQDGGEMLRDILAQAERAGDIVKNLLDFSRTERPAFSALPPGEVVKSTLALLRNQIMLSGVRLETELPEGLPELRGNLRNLQQVFMNLLLNAMQATPSGGLIRFAVAAEGADLIRFEVRDTGKGMEPETLQHIFEPFYTTKEVGRGTGLGLAVAYAIVKRHGGRIEVQSAPGQGSVFFVHIPQAERGSAT